MRRVYQFGLLPPTENDAVVRRQLRAAHEYRNDLVAIERGRRHALRAIDDTSEVREAADAVKNATRSTRKAAVTELRATRKAARDAASDELATIAERESELRLGARALTTCFWGSYLDIEAAHNQARSAPLYEDDAVTPSNPRFVRGPRLGREAFSDTDPRSAWWLGEGQIGVQLQGGLATADALRGDDTRVRLVLESEGQRARFGKRAGRRGTLWLRVGSDGRAPVWAKWPVKLHRAIPDTAVWKWVRVSLAREAMRERWSVEITVDDSAEHPHERDRDLQGAVAVEFSWTPRNDGSIHVATWANTHGEHGEVLLPARAATGIRKPDGHRAVRDIVLNDLRPKLARAIKESKDTLPAWLREAGATLHLWKSPDRFRGLAMRWRKEQCDAARPAYEILDAWEGAENHLYDYECGARGDALKARREIYRLLAARWSRQYRTLLLSDQDLSREARFGEESDVRFTVAIYELRGALRNAFGEALTIETRWRLPPLDEDDERLWCERVRDAWNGGALAGMECSQNERRKR